MRFATCQDYAAGDDIAGSLAVNPICAQPKSNRTTSRISPGQSQKSSRQPFCKKCVALWPCTPSVYRKIMFAMRLRLATNRATLAMLIGHVAVLTNAK
jgi:hypothetical protein